MNPLGFWNVGFAIRVSEFWFLNWVFDALKAFRFLAEFGQNVALELAKSSLQVSSKNFDGTWATLGYIE